VLLYALAGLAVTTVFAVMSYQAWHQDAVLSDRGQPASARVVTVRKSVQVEFRTADGRLVKAFLGEGDEGPGPRPAVGDQIPIVYDPQDPTSDVRHAQVSPSHTGAKQYLLFALMAALGTVVGTVTVAVTRVRDKYRAWRSRRVEEQRSG
jgi:hypothetical protein